MGVARCAARASWAAGWLLVAMATGSARAQPAPDGADAGVRELPPVTVPLPPEESPASVARRDPTGASFRVDAASRAGEAKQTSELLSSAPGVMVHDQGGLAGRKTVSVRGAAPNGVLVLLDGIPLNGAGGNADLGRVSPAVVERLEVLRGAAGARYGSGGLGGVVNVVTREASAPRAFAELLYGSFQTAQMHAGVQGELVGGQGLVLFHGARSAGDFPYLFDERPALEGDVPVELRRENNEATRVGGLLKLRRGFGDAQDTVADGLLEVSVDRRGLAGPAQNPNPDAVAAGDRQALSLRVTRRVDAVLAGELSARVFGLRDALTLSGGGYATAYPQDFRSAGAELTAQALVYERHALSGLVTVAGDWLSSGGALGSSWARAAAMVSDEWMLLGGGLTLVPSLRVDQTGPFTGVSPKAGASLLLPSGFELRANAGQAHRAPSFLELYVQQGNLMPNPDLRPERALFADGAVQHRTGRSFVSVGAFFALYEDLISYEYYPPMLARPYNFATAQVWGLEVEGEARPLRWASVGGGYTLTATENLRDDPRYYRQPLPYRPRHKVAVRAGAGAPVARARAELLYQSSQTLNRTGTLALPERAFLNLGLSSRLVRAPEVVASLEVKNVLDVHSADLDGYPLPGRSAYLTLSVSLERGGPQGE